jgi:hypothetical protein
MTCLNYVEYYCLRVCECLGVNCVHFVTRRILAASGMLGLVVSQKLAAVYCLHHQDETTQRSTPDDSRKHVHIVLHTCLGL